MTKKKRKANKTSEPFTSGQLNRLVDDLCHPFFQENKGYVLVDGLLHAIVEQNPPVSIKKFVQYNVPELVRRKRKTTKKKLHTRFYRENV